MNNKNSKLLYIISILLWFSLYCYVAEFSIYALGIGATMSQLGTIVSCYGLVQTLTRIPIGIISDILKKRKIFISLAMLLSLLANLLVIFIPQITTLYIFKIICGLTASCWVLYTITYVSYFDTMNSKMAIGHINGANSLGQIFGMLFGGIIMVVVKDIKSVFILSAIAASIGCFLSLKLTEVQFESKKVKYNDFIELFKDKNLLFCSILAIFTQIVMYSITFTYGPILVESYGLDGMMRSLYIAAGILPTALFAKTFCSKWLERLGIIKLLISGYLIILIMIITIILLKSIYVLYIGHFLIGIGYAMTFPVLMAASGTKVDESKKATAMGVFQAIYGLGIIIGPSLLGVIIDNYNIYIGFSSLLISTSLAIVLVIMNKTILYKKQKI